MKYALVKITAKIYVDDDEMEEVHADALEEEFERIAREKVADHFPTDDPMKLLEVEINMDSYKS